jgi:uncharacterized Zn finger protein (UPF0148 family)
LRGQKLTVSPQILNSGNAKKGGEKVTSLHRTTCPKCGYPTLYKNARTLCCNARISDVKPEIKAKSKRHSYKPRQREHAPGLGPGSSRGGDPLRAEENQGALIENVHEAKNGQLSLF